jgi:peptidyl-prolyl cis-trans isomerase C
MRPLFTVLTALIIGSMALTGCGSANEKVATIDGAVISKADYDVVYQEYAKKFRVQFGAMDEQNPMAKEMLKSLTLKKLIMNTMVKKEADSLGVSVTEADVQQLKDEQIKLMGGPERLQKMLAQTQQTPADFDKQIREIALLNKFLEKKGGGNLKPSDKDVEAYYIGHPKDFDMPETIQASHILVKAIDQEIRKTEREKNKNLSEEELNKKVAESRDAAHKKALELDKQVKASPADFAKVAEKSSDDLVSGKNGGDLGPMVEKALDPVFWSAIKKTQPGAFYPGVLETQFGYHIVKVAKHEPPRHQTFDEAKPLISNALETQKKMALLQKWEQDTRAKVAIKIEPAYEPNFAPPGGMPGGQAPAGGQAPQTQVPQAQAPHGQAAQQTDSHKAAQH